MSKFFSFVGYLVTVVGAALGILYLINKFSAKDDLAEEDSDTEAEETAAEESAEEAVSEEEAVPAAE